MSGATTPSQEELFDLIVEALGPLDPNTQTATGKRIYLAYLAGRLGQGANDVLSRRFAGLRRELGI